ncbi:hypothetical protein BDD12DRAFT_40795 [Trichophaea hybrida]|nr:hypothetical protein BDD12DRAFT_40795 [Trichophaea hybrida]
MMRFPHLRPNPASRSFVRSSSQPSTLSPHHTHHHHRKHYPLPPHYEKKAFSPYTIMSFTLRTTTTTTAATPVKKPVGAFRGGIFGFLLGSVVAGGASYFYVYEEYKVANDLLTEDIDALRTATLRLEKHVRTLEEHMANITAAANKGKK